MIPQNNPLANYLASKPAIDAAIDSVLSHGQYIFGREVTSFELEFADYIRVKHIVSMGSGTEALHLLLRACGIGPGNEVITVSHTAVATIAAIEMCGAVPVLVDIDPESYTIAPDIVEEVITKATRAIVAVHLYGQPADLHPLVECAKRFDLYLFEDCAQAHGAIYHNQKVGSWGDAGVFSFYPTKNLGALGDGGAVATNSSKLSSRLRSIRQYGWDHQRLSRMKGYNSRLDELQAAILRIKLMRLDHNNKERSRIAQIYGSRLESLPVHLPSSMPYTSHVFHQYVIRCENKPIRDGLIKFMKDQNIQCAVHYPVPVHLQPAYINRLRIPNSLPVTERTADRIISLPMFPELTDSDLDKITENVSDYFRHAI